jgi:phosphohistidine swiveling domain-containing protein
MQELTWEPPSPGPWTQDSAHNPIAQTLIMQELYPAGFDKGFTETFAEFGLLLDRLAMGVVNGFTYHQPQPFDMPGPDGPRAPEWIAEEFGRRAATAERAMNEKIWRDVMRRWDDELKPAAQARHVELGSVDLAALDDEQLRAHLEACCAHVSEMVYQHHRFNAHALVPVGDLLLQTAAWVHRPPDSMFGVFDGHSPTSNVSPPEMQEALAALRSDPTALELLASDLPPADVLSQLRARVPAVDRYVANVHFRLVEGFDVVGPTIGERPACIVGRLSAALGVDRDVSMDRSDEAAAELRAAVPAEHQASFDDLLADARLVYRLRDERGLYSDISAVGLLRLALLEAGRRQQERGRLFEADDLLEARVGELWSILDGSGTPTAEELRDRGTDRLARTLAGAPRHLGPPAPAPPPLDTLPPALGRVMGAVGFAIQGILGQLDAPEGDASTVGGIPGAAGVYEGPARLIRSIDDLIDLQFGEIMVTPATGEAFNSMLHLVGAIVTDHGSFACHAAIVSREMGIPAVVGTVDGTRRIATGTLLRVDGTAGTVTLV